MKKRFVDLLLDIIGRLDEILERLPKCTCPEKPADGEMSGGAGFCQVHGPWSY